MDLLQFEKEYRVHVYETGPDGMLNLYSLFNYLQDIASEHAVRLGFGRDDLMKENHFWVLSRMYAEIAEWPKWEDTIIVKTWPNGTDKLFAMRNYEVKYPDGRPIALASSSWLILDQTTKRVQRPDSALSHYNFNLNSDNAPIRHASKLEPIMGNEFVSAESMVKVSDLDLNLHTNNVRYLMWVYGTYDLEFMMKNHPRSTEINYLAESVYGEVIFIKSSIEDENPNLRKHSIIRKNDNKELCRIKIEWDSRE